MVQTIRELRMLLSLPLDFQRLTSDLEGFLKITGTFGNDAQIGEREGLHCGIPRSPGECQTLFQRCPRPVEVPLIEIQFREVGQRGCYTPFVVGFPAILKRFFEMAKGIVRSPGIEMGNAQDRVDHSHRLRVVFELAGLKPRAENGDSFFATTG